MHQKIIITPICFFLSAMTLNVYAQESGQPAIPDKVKANILKRHPNAQEMQAGYETHFKRRLLEVSYKEEGVEEPILELFREDGHLFTNEMQLDDLGEAPPQVKEALEKNFPGYTLKKAQMLANPNGAGEEYEIYLLAGGANWKVSVTEKGVIEGKDHF